MCSHKVDLKLRDRQGQAVGQPQDEKLMSNPFQRSRVPRTKRGERQGAAAVELALVLPLLVFLVMGILTIAQLIYFRKALVIAASEGIRLASERTASAEDVESRVNVILAARRIDGVEVAVTPDVLANLEPGSQVSIRVSAPFEAFGMSYLGLSAGTTPAVEASILRE